MGPGKHGVGGPHQEHEAIPPFTTNACQSEPPHESFKDSGSATDWSCLRLPDRRRLNNIYIFVYYATIRLG